MSDHEPTISNLPNDWAVTIVMHQSTIDGLVALINWLDGFEEGGHKRVPGHFELVMHFRSLVRAIREKQYNE